jgi:hypothetical protein
MLTGTYAMSYYSTVYFSKVLENETYIDELNFELQLRELSLFSYFIVYKGENLCKILSSTKKPDPHGEKCMWIIVRTKHESLIDIH